MDVPDLAPMGPSGFYAAPDRAVLAGRGFVISADFAAVAADAERFVGLELDADHFAVVWSVSAGSIAGGTGNSPGKLTAYAGEVASPTVITPVNLINTGPAAAGIFAEYGSSLEAGSIAGDSNSFSLAGQNILNGIRVFGPSSKVAVGVTNLAAVAADMSVSVLLAIFSKTEIEDVTI